MPKDPIDPLLCDNPEFEPSRSPDPGGSCDVEIRLKNTHFVTGQGASEGKGEISTIVTTKIVGDPGFGQQTFLPPTGEIKYTPGQKVHHGADLGTYTVGVGQTLDVEVHAQFVEHDYGGINGNSDFAEGSTVVTLECDPVHGQSSFTSTIGPETFCGDSVCNGSMSATVKVMRADADGDCVPNDDDFTPEPCDEADKGKEGIALLQYFHYDDDGFTTLMQGVGSRLSKPYPAYDHVVLLIDNDGSNPAYANAAAVAGADMTFEPTREGLMDAMQYLTSEGYRFDVFVHAHGYKRFDQLDEDEELEMLPDDSSFETLENHPSITGDWLVEETKPGLIGTPRGGVPIVAWWSTTCIAERMIDAWTTIGAVVASGAVDVQFYPNAYGNFVDEWIGGQTYQDAVDLSVTPGVVFAAETLVNLQGEWFPYLCLGPDGVIFGGPCADDFFNDSVGGHEAQYNIWEVYDFGATGAQNMENSSERSFIGETAITFGGGPRTWP